MQRYAVALNLTPGESSHTLQIRSDLSAQVFALQTDGLGQRRAETGIQACSN